MAEFGSLQDDRSVSFVLISTDWPPEGARWSKVADPPPPPPPQSYTHTPKKNPPCGGYRVKMFVAALYVAVTLYNSVTGQCFKNFPYISCKVDLYITVT